jgi:hypothetical protein
MAVNLPLQSFCPSLLTLAILPLRKQILGSDGEITEEFKPPRAVDAGKRIKVSDHLGPGGARNTDAPQ